MLPEDLRTVTMPSWTVHLAGDLSLTVIHSSSCWPSKRMMASEGAAGETAGPGVITLGTGCHCSVSSGLGLLTGLGSSAAKLRRGRRAMRIKSWGMGLVMNASRVSVQEKAAAVMGRWWGEPHPTAAGAEVFIEHAAGGRQIGGEGHIVGIGRWGGGHKRNSVV